MNWLDRAARFVSSARFVSATCFDSPARFVTERSRLVVAAMLLATVAIGAGAPMVEESSSVEGISSDSDVARAQDAVRDNFSARGTNTTTTVVAVRNSDGNVLSRASLLRSLEYQRALRTNATLNATLVDERPTTGVANLVATAGIAADLEARASGLRTALNETRRLQANYELLNASRERGDVDDETYRTRATRIERSLGAVRTRATANLSAAEAAQFNRSSRRVRTLTQERAELRRRDDRGDLDRDEYRSRANELGNATADAYRTGSVGVFADEFDRLANPDSQPPIDEQIAQLREMDEGEFQGVLGRVLDPDSSAPASRAAYRLLPRDYEPGSTSADARTIVVTQATAGTVRDAVSFSEDVADGQSATRAMVKERNEPESYRLLSRGLMGRQQQAAIEDSLAVLGPLALAFVLVALSVAYRDPVDVMLGLLGVGVVLVWTVGAMGWLGMAFGQTMIAAPILLIGLSVDYAFHVVTRYREERHRRDADVREAMAGSLVGVGPALALVTVTTAIGFLANLTSPLGGIRDFGVVTALGIVATLFVFCLFVPAAKTELAAFLERRGWDRTPAPPGSRVTVRRLLGGGATLARRAPAAVLVVALLVSAGGAYTATGVEVSASQELFMADDPPEWTDELPDAVEPGEFYLKENRRYVYETFQSPDQQGYVLVEGNVTAPETLRRVESAGRLLRESDAAFVGPDGDPAVVTPLSAMQATGERNETFAGTLAAADVDGDGVPDENLTAVYDAFADAAPVLAERTVHRTDGGEYAAVRLRTTMNGDVDRSIAVGTLRESADRLSGHPDLEATATGTAAVEERNTAQVATSMVEGLAVTLLVVLALLALVFRVKEGSATLGALTLVPVALAVTWLLGTMAAIGFPISPVTALVGSIAVGLGVDYAIHVSERFAEERGRVDRRRALDRTVTGTGSAMLSSAATTAAGFGVLSFSLLPALRQFGFILAVGIAYAFVATVYVQPSLLALWDRYGDCSVATFEPGATPGDD